MGPSFSGKAAYIGHPLGEEPLGSAQHLGAIQRRSRPRRPSSAAHALGTSDESGEKYTSEARTVAWSRTRGGSRSRSPELAPEHQDQLSLRRLGHALEREEGRQVGSRGTVTSYSRPRHRSRPSAAAWSTRRRGRHRLHPSRSTGGLAVEIEERIERLAVLPGEVLLRRPVVGLELGRPGAPFEMMPQLVGQRLPRLGPPVETGLELREAWKEPW